MRQPGLGRAKPVGRGLSLSEPGKRDSQGRRSKEAAVSVGVGEGRRFRGRRVYDLEVGGGFG